MVKFEVHRDLTGQFRWRLYAGNEVVACSGHGFANRIECELAIEKLRQLVAEASVASYPQEASESGDRLGLDRPRA